MLSDKLKKLYTSSGNDVILETLQVSHTTFSNDFYIVKDFQDFTANLENSGPQVTFNKYSFSVNGPNKGSDGNITLNIVIDAVNLTLINLLETAVQDTNNNPITIIHRVYVQSDTTGPQRDPIKLQVRSLSINNFTISATAEMVGLENKKFLNINYDHRFKSLLINA